MQRCSRQQILKLAQDYYLPDSSLPMTTKARTIPEDEESTNGKDGVRKNYFTPKASRQRIRKD